jgi:hypothetical protein
MAGEARMLTNLSRRAYELDIWLHENVGRPYIAILSLGLAISMLDSVRSLAHTLSDSVNDLGDIIGLLLALAFQSGLLINQMAQWHERRMKHRRQRAK